MAIKKTSTFSITIDIDIDEDTPAVERRYPDGLWQTIPLGEIILNGLYAFQARAKKDGVRISRVSYDTEDAKKIARFLERRVGMPSTNALMHLLAFGKQDEGRKKEGDTTS